MLTMDDIDESQQAGLYCPECAATNPSQRKFCSKCGTSLWEPCFQCGDLCAVGEMYCGACGANLLEMSAEQVELARVDLCTAAEMISACRFEEAIALLSCISKKDHPRLAEYAARAKELIGQISVQRRRQQVAAEEACQRARQCLAAFDYDSAAEIIENVPLPLQDDDVQQLRNQIAERRQEIDTLVEELRIAVRQKRLLDLPPRIQRLLALKPDHAYAKSLAEQVQKPVAVAVKKMLAKHHYDQAQHLLSQISVQTDTPDFQRLRQDTAELSWLAWDLRNAPVIDDTLVAVAKRLRELASDDPRVAKLHEELHRRIRRIESQPCLEPPSWANPPEQSPLGVPIDWLAGLQSITCMDGLDRSDLLKNPGRFAVACGLALAGVGQASLQINLRPTQQPSVLHRVTRLMRSDITVARKAWGIDLGISGLKAIKLAWHAPRQAVIEAAVMIEHAKPLSQAANEIEQKKLVADTLRTFLEAQQPKTERMCIGLPGCMALARYVDLPAVKDAKARKLVRFEAAHQFPVPLERLHWDFQILDNLIPSNNSSSKPTGGEGRRALLIGVQRHAIDRFVESFRLQGMGIDVIQPDFIALHNYIAHEVFTTTGNPSSGEPHGAVAAIDVGADVTNVIVSSPQSIWFHSCGVAGHSFARALVKDFKLSLAQAEQFKRKPESAERLSEFCESLSPVFDDLLKEVQQSLSAYAEAHPDCPVQRVVGLGGGFSLHGLFRHFRCGR